MANKTEKILEALADYATECYAEGIAEGIKNKWIPCSERKPEPETRVIVTVKSVTNHRYTTTAFYENGKINTEDSGYGFTETAHDRGWEYVDEEDAFIIPESWWEDDGGENVFEIDDDYEVIAWQPLPEPYKE